MTVKIHEVQALIVRQWLNEWDEVYFSEDEHRRKPNPEFYLLTLPATYLKKLSAVYRRKADKPRSQDTAIQRTYEKARSEEINKFIHGGFPWSDLSDRQKEQSEYRDLKMPGWLPTAIVANILPPNAVRGKLSLKEEHAITIKKLNDNWAKIILPKGFDRKYWEPSIPPIEIIDGQHRLFAFEEDDRINGDYYLPVVAFYDLDITWQAYLFFTINIKPKKINISLAYDLYPLLRIQDWLEKSPNGPIVYRETRAQELTEVLWSHPRSPWKGRINMLGEKKGGDVTQAAFIRSLLTSYVKRRGPGTPIGGLFGDELVKKMGNILRWSRVKQAAFLIVVWECMQEAVKESTESWAKSLRRQAVQKQLPLVGQETTKLDPAFAGSYSLLATDQGVRGVLQVTNDMCFMGAEKLDLAGWMLKDVTSEDELNESTINTAVVSLETHPVKKYLATICRELTRFDWRTSSAPDIITDEARRRAQMVFKGSSGYKELRNQLITLLCSTEDQLIRSNAIQVKNFLGY